MLDAHTANLAQNGLPGPQHIAHYRERALGRAAMIMVEPVPVHPAAVLTRGNFSHSDDAGIPAQASPCWSLAVVLRGWGAARVAAERGFPVTLPEAGSTLGGQFRLAGLQRRRAQITDLLA